MTAIRVNVRRDVHGEYVASLMDFPGVESRGSSRSEVLVELQMAVVEAFGLHDHEDDPGLLEVRDVDGGS